jgi:hypothetical protein
VSFLGVVGNQAHDRAVGKIRDRFGWDAIDYGSVALGISFRSRRISRTRREGAVTVNSFFVV